MEGADFHHFAGDAVDFDPVAQPHAVFAHQNKPADEADNEILQSDGEAGAGEAEEGAELSRRPEKDQQD